MFNFLSIPVYSVPKPQKGPYKMAVVHASTGPENLSVIYDPDVRKSK
jgi:hypothetical protein